jgi:DNA-binding transcriptional LysR family regulator
MTNGEGDGAFPKRKTPRFRTGPSWLTAMGFQRLAAGRVLELKVENPKSNRTRARKAEAKCPANFAGRGWTFCSYFVLVRHLFWRRPCLLEVPMTVEKQREVIRLWNQLRKLEGPAAEELRIQILECFSEKNFSEKDTVKRAA